MDNMSAILVFEIYIFSKILFNKKIIFIYSLKQENFKNENEKSEKRIN